MDGCGTKRYSCMVVQQFQKLIVNIMKEDWKCHKCPIVTATDNMIACDICQLSWVSLFILCRRCVGVQSQPDGEWWCGSCSQRKKTVFVISITCTAPLFIIANKTHMHTHCSRENVAHKITPVRLRSNRVLQNCGKFLTFIAR